MHKRAIRDIVVSVFGIVGLAQITPVFAANSGNVNFSAKLQSSTTVTIPNDPVVLALSPSGSGSFGSTSFDISVSTNQPGYTITMDTSSTTLTSDTINPDTNDFFTIPTLDHTEEGYTEDNFTRNRWGIAINDGNFNAALTTSNIKDTNVTANNEITKISLGANLDMMTATGSYQTTINFAVTTKVAPLVIGELTNLQDFATLNPTDLDSVKTSMITDTAYELRDSRDNTTYHIAKLADGRIWFLDNLALDLTDATVQSKLTSTTTNATTTSISALLNGGRAGGDQYATSGVSSDWTDKCAESDYDETMVCSYSDPLIDMTNRDTVPDNAPANGKGYNKVGGYYNFCAASAGSYCYGDGTSAGTSSGNATEDICPAGWRMPTGDATGEYAALAKIIYGSTDMTTNATAIANYRNALSLPFSGDSFAGSVEDQGSYGYFWASTNAGYDDGTMYNLYTYISNVYPHISSFPYYGYSVRCIAKGSDTVITYNANGGTGEMTKQTITDTQVVAGTNQLTANTFTRDDYVFAGWNTAADGSGTSYADGAIYTGSSTTLYAQWRSPVITDLTYMQDFASLSSNALTSVKNSMATDTAYILKDNRDETSYHVSKLADGKIWLLDNLALDLTNSTILNNMIPENTNASATSLTSLRSGNRSAGDQYATAGVGNLTSGNSYSVPLVNMASKDVVPDNAPTGGKGNNKVGGYYNVCAASAGSYCYGDGTSQGTSSGNATEDICPAGWRLPTGNTTGEYAALANAIYGSTGSTTDATAVANYHNALSLPLSGRFNDGSASNQGSYGYFWSSTRRDDNLMYRLSVGTGNVYPALSYYRSGGAPVRCVAS